SAGCALASDAYALIALRVLQGIGGAAVVSIGPAILRSAFPGRLLGRILGLNALLIAASTAIAPIVGGTLLDAWGWQWLFALNIVPGAMALAIGMKTIPAGPRAAHGPFDTPGAWLSAALLGALIMTANHVTMPGGGWYALVALLAGAGFV